MTEATDKTCLACHRSDDEIPLIGVEYRGNRLWICPQHLPVLIHDPGRLAGLLPGAEDMQPFESDD